MIQLRYRTKLRVKKALRFLSITLGVLLVASIGILIYADSLILYDETGAHFNGQFAQTEETAPTEPRPVVENPIVLEEQAQAFTLTIQELGGYYITTSMLRDIEKTRAALETVQPCAVMLELKSIYGNYYYSSRLSGAPKADVDIAAIDALITDLNERGFYTIASIPAFVDPVYAVEHQSSGLPLSSGALWMDERGCYWLDPGDDVVISHLMQIARELSNRGFREVSFSHFYFPQSDRIVYSSQLSKSEILRQAVKELCDFFANDDFMVSFQTDLTDFPADSASGRLYIYNADGNQVERFVQSYSGSESLQELVFLANSKDSRFESHAMLRPLLAE